MQANSLLFLLPPGIEPPFQVRIGLASEPGELLAKGDLLIAYCDSINDAINKALQLLEQLRIEVAEDFLVIFPPFQGTTDAEEALIIDRAWNIKFAADEHGWQFGRFLPSDDF